MKERMKAVRKAVKKTQSEFAAEIHVSKSTIEAYEYGRTDPTDRTIDIICRNYNVNEIWLRTGEGEMFAPDQEREIADMADRLLDCDSKLKKDLVNVIMSLDEENLETFLQVGKEILAGIEKDLPN